MTCKPAPDEILYKDPQAVLDYGFDWNDDGHGGEGWLGVDTILASTWAANKSGLTIQSQSFDTTSTTVWLAGGTLGEGYTVTNHITTAGGRQDDRSFKLVIKNK